MTRILFQRCFGPEGFELNLQLLADGRLCIETPGEEDAVLDAETTKELGAAIVAKVVREQAR